jgi:2-polyprenyl-3-methyl-5-hydroxy-6-metoxy-1,4-benzoquinol methylase
MEKEWEKYSPKNLPKRYRLLKPYIKQKKVLHLGCVDHDWVIGHKEWIHGFIAEYADEVVGLDILEEDIKKLNQLGYDVRCGDAENFDLGKQFDVIFAGELIEHLENFGGFLESCKRHMKKDSKLILTTPNCFGLRFIICHLLNRRPFVYPVHTCWFDEETLLHTLDRHGMQIDFMKYIALEHEFSKGIKAVVLRSFNSIPKSAPILFIVASKKA